jgi:hypothetical protein
MRVLLALVVCLSVSACKGPQRSDVQSWEVVGSGKIRPEDNGLFMECVMDGFDRSHFTMTNISVRQQRRSDGYRIESMVNSAVLMSADILDNGNVSLSESVSAGLTDTRGERNAFATCLRKFATPG